MLTQDIRVADLQPAKYNPRKISDGEMRKLMRSIETFGFVEPVVVNSDMTIIGGHQRVLAAKSLGMEEVPCVVLDLPKGREKALNLALNRISGEWDETLLKTLLEGLDETERMLSGFDEAEIAKALDLAMNGEEDGFDTTPPEEPKSKLGDLYILGDHKLLCGDASKREDVERLMGGEKADMVFTDPPYGMFLDTDYDGMFAHDKLHRKTGHRFKAVVGDHADFTPELISSIFTSFDYCKEMFIWGADYFSELIPARKDGAWIVWDKRCGENMDKVSGNTFELCWSRQKHKRSIARILWSGHHGMQKDDTRTRVHPTQKPVKLIEWFFEQWGHGLVVVADLFGGSGSTLIACEQTGRKCRMMELSENYCDVILDRWSKLTGKEPIRLADGKTWSKIKEDGN